MNLAARLQSLEVAHFSAQIALQRTISLIEKRVGDSMNQRVVQLGEHIERVAEKVEVLAADLAAEKRDRNVSEEQLDAYLRQWDDSADDAQDEDLNNTIDEIDERLYALAGRIEVAESRIRDGEIFLRGARDLGDIHERGFEKFVDRYDYRLRTLERRFKAMPGVTDGNPGISESGEKKTAEAEKSRMQQQHERHDLCLQDAPSNFSEIRLSDAQNFGSSEPDRRPAVRPPCPLGCAGARAGCGLDA